MRSTSHHIVAIGLLSALTSFGAHAFEVSFEWGAIPLCTSGNPGRVPNPIFTLRGVPQGTKTLEFLLTDIDAPDYRHGGGTVTFSGQARIEPGAFTYYSPCPPDGSHTYEWSVEATDGSGEVLGETTVEKDYPE